MAFEKRYTAKHVAEAILKISHDLLAKSELVKAEKMDKCGTFSKVHEKAKREGYSEASADKIAGKAKAMEKYEPENSKKLGYKLPEAGRNEKQPEKSDKAFEVEKQAPANALGPESAASGKNSPMPAVQKNEDPRLNKQPAPGNNPKEEDEGNNELAGTTPTQVGQDGKNVPGGDEIKGAVKLAQCKGVHKLAKFSGRMMAKREMKKGF